MFHLLQWLSLSKKKPLDLNLQRSCVAHTVVSFPSARHDSSKPMFTSKIRWKTWNTGPDLMNVSPGFVRRATDHPYWWTHIQWGRKRFLFQHVWTWTQRLVRESLRAVFTNWKPNLERSWNIEINPRHRIGDDQESKHGIEYLRIQDLTLTMVRLWDVGNHGKLSGEESGNYSIYNRGTSEPSTKPVLRAERFAKTKRSFMESWWNLPGFNPEHILAHRN